MSKTIFLSHFLSEETPGYGGNPGFRRRHVNRMSEGASSNTQEWTMSNHIGTHIDLPAHFDDQGARLQDFSATDWIFRKVHLVDLPVSAGMIIDVSDELEEIPQSAEFAILKTGFQRYRCEDAYWKNNPGLAPELGHWLRKSRPNLRVLGFDFISITPYANRPLGREAHKAFLAGADVGRPVRVIEDMKLDELLRSPSLVVVAPTLIQDADGAQVTVIAEV